MFIPQKKRKLMSCHIFVSLYSTPDTMCVSQCPLQVTLVSVLAATNEYDCRLRVLGDLRDNVVSMSVHSSSLTRKAWLNIARLVLTNLELISRFV